MGARAPSDHIEVSTSSQVLPQLEVAIQGRIPVGIPDACLLASLVLVVVLCIYLMWETRAWTQTTAEQAELNVVDTIASDIRRTLEGLHVAVTKTSQGLQVPGVAELSPAERQAVLFGTSTGANAGSAIYLIGADGRLLGMADDQAPPAVNFSDWGYFEFHRSHPDTALHVSDSIVDRLKGEPVIVLSKRMNDSDGRFAGIVAGSVDVSSFHDLFNKFALGGGRVIALVNRNGRIVAREPMGIRTATVDTDTTVVSEHAARGVSGTYTAISKLDGRRRLIAYRQIQGFPFIVSYGRPTEEVFAQWTRGSLVIGGALLVLSALAVFMIGELRGERRRRAGAERSARRSANDLAIANTNLEQRISREVQARKETQEKLAKSQRFEALGQLAGGIAHDINNVLQTVTGACTLVQMQEAANDDIQRLTAIAISAADRGSAVTQRLLVFARRAAIKAECIDTTAILDGLQELLSHTLNDNIVLKLDLAADVPNLIADRMQLETVMINLATNARDAMPDGGTITIAARAAIVGADDAGAAGLSPGRYVHLSVADTGMGMDEHILARATEPFFSTKSVGQGTGLGLSMAKGFAEQSNGKLAIVSSVGAGTTVSLWFPASDESPADVFIPAPPAVHATRANSNIRVLVVDDNVEARELVSEWLAASGFEVHRADSGEAALSTVEAGLDVDLLLTDLSMAGMDGLELIREIGARVPDLPAILLTGDTSAIADLSTTDAFGDGCMVLQKPIRFSELGHYIENVLGRGSARSAGCGPAIRSREREILGK
jgi:signal transduction histidine kinase/CheY-like chemotaxis protein